MTEGTDLLKAAAALFNEFTWLQLVPALTFLLMAVLLIVAVGRAQRDLDNPFDVAEFFRDEASHKLSMKKLLGAGCFGVHSWFFYSRTVSNTITFNDTVLYCLTWSGSLILLDALSVLRGSIKAPPVVGQQDFNPAGDGSIPSGATK